MRMGQCLLAGGMVGDVREGMAATETSKRPCQYHRWVVVSVYSQLLSSQYTYLPAVSACDNNYAALWLAAVRSVKVKTTQQITSSQFLTTTQVLQHNQTDRMASKLLSKMVSSKIDGIFKGDSDDEKTPPTDKELKVNLWSDERTNVLEL